MNYENLKADLLDEAREEVILPANDAEACRVIMDRLVPYFMMGCSPSSSNDSLFHLIVDYSQDALYELLDGLAFEFTEHGTWNEFVGIEEEDAY